jgi:cystathionine beta-lyase/cystathionine gamma-synthase
MEDGVRLGSTVPLVTPLYQSSVYTITDLDALERLYGGQDAGFIYARDGHPNAAQLAAQLARMEKAHWAVVCSSGMAALTAAILTLIRSGDRIVASHRLYGRTTQLLQQELPRFGVQTTFVDSTDLAAVRQALSTPARLLLVETMSNPTCRLADLSGLADLCEQADVNLIVDNTFATPVLLRPLEWGADMVVESLTKFMSGHGDVVLGTVCGADPALLTQLNQTVSIWGFASNPFDCWLTERGLATLDLRMRAASSNAAALADWLATQPGVRQVIYPGRPDHPDYRLAQRLLNGRFGNMLCFELDGGRDAVNRFMRQAPAIPFSPSLGSTQTTCSYPAGTSHRYDTPEERKVQGITDGMIRLSVGIEPLEAIKEALASGLSIAKKLAI